jgi:phenylacetate-CoA ligase
MSLSSEKEDFCSRQQLEATKLRRLNSMFAEVLPANNFYREKLSGCKTPVQSLDELSDFPWTTKSDLVGNVDTVSAQNRTWSDEHYVRFHQTSGTSGRPLQIWDTQADWEWWMTCWEFIYSRACLQPGEPVFIAASFGPYIGFWSAFEGAVASGGRAIPSGGLSSIARLELLQKTEAKVLVATPTYALHLAEVAKEHGYDTSRSTIRCIIVAGEPGGSLDSVRHRLAAAWGADVLDHSGATEIGPWGVGWLQHSGLEVLEEWFHPEFRAITADRPARQGELAELVLTTLGRTGCPVIRYRTGDVVKPAWPTHQEIAEGRSPRVWLEGGILGRTDDMLVIRGVNVFPSAVENIIKSFPEVVEHRLTVNREGNLDMLSIEIEDQLSSPARVAQELHVRLGLRIRVQEVPVGTLPRFEGKARRVIDNRE